VGPGINMHRYKYKSTACVCCVLTGIWWWLCQICPTVSVPSHDDAWTVPVYGT